MSTREKAEVFLSKSDAFIADLGLSQVPDCWASYGARIVRDLLAEAERLRLALETATRELDEEQGKRLESQAQAMTLLAERDEARGVLRDIATFGWYAKGAKVARAYLAAREGR